MRKQWAKRFAAGQTPALANPAMSFTSRSNDREAVIKLCPKSFALQRNGRNRHYYENQENGDGDTENAEQCEVNYAQMRVQGQHENNSDRKKLSSKREGYLG